MLPISQAAQRFHLSRSTLLYYDRLGLVRPSYRTAAGYRLYQEEDLERLELISRYRAAGMPLKDIREILDPDAPGSTGVQKALRKRLGDLNGEIAILRRQQQAVLNLLGNGEGPNRIARAMTKDKWIAMLRDIGMSEMEMQAWHRTFERRTPEAHQDFLESLGIPPEEIRRIRLDSQTKPERPQTRASSPAKGASHKGLNT